ncbi:MAG: GNAT family N-acetyltransferase [Rubrobacteraceae bacterium]
MTAEKQRIADDTERRTTVRKATAGDVAGISESLAKAFRDDPVTEWWLPDKSSRMRRARRVFEEIFLKRICLPHDETYTTGELVGGALWMPPEKWHLGFLDNLRLLPHMAAAFGRRLPRVMRSLGHMDAKHPHEPHYYLFIVGVEPEWQGRGIGSALMRPVLDRCDRERLPAYLEATTPRNRELYRRDGFEVVEEIELPGGGPPLWRMWREPGLDAPPSEQSTQPAG